MDKFKAFLKQAHVWGSFGMLLYIAAKLYVISTPTPNDDILLEKVRSAIVMLAEQNEWQEANVEQAKENV